MKNVPPEWPTAKAASLRVGAICGSIPLVGAWAPNERIALAMAAFRLAQMHLASVHALIVDGRLASAQVLVRPCIEAALSTIWLIEKATDVQLYRISKGRESALLDARTLAEVLFDPKGSLNGKHRGLRDGLLQSGVSALDMQFLEGEALDRAKGSTMKLAATALALAGYSVALFLRRNDLLSELSAELSSLT